MRTRKQDLIEAGDIVWDVGLVFDPVANRFDHHQRGAPLRADGTPYSSAGLVWQVYGERAVAALLPPGDAAQFGPAIAATIDASMVRRIDELDNGVSGTGPVVNDSLGLAALIGDCNPSWDDPAANGPKAGDAAFLEATALAASVLRRRVDGVRSGWPPRRSCWRRIRPAMTTVSSCSIRVCPGRTRPSPTPCRFCSPCLQRRTETGWSTPCRRSPARLPSACRFRRGGPVCRGRSWRRRQAWRMRFSCMSAAFVAPREGAPTVDLLDLDGRILPIPLETIRTIAFVRDFNRNDPDDPERLARRAFLARPRTEGLWVRLTLLGGDLFEGLAPLDLSLLDALLDDRGLFLIPPDIRSNTQRLFVPRTAILTLQLLAVITTPTRSKPSAAPKADPAQDSLF